MERVALYCRVSSEEQSRHGLSLDEQERSLREYAKDHNMLISDCYVDAGISARKRYTKRPELLRLLSDIEADKIDTVLFIRLDRWFRNVADYYEVQKILDTHEVKWIATQEDYETVTASGRFKVNIMLSVAQDEADRDSERIRFIFDGKKQRNESTNGRVPKGYKIENKQIIYDTEIARQIRGVFETFWKTGSSTKIIEQFPDLNLNYYSVRRILQNRGYTGDFCGIHIPPIITEDEYEKTQKQRAIRHRKTKHNTVYLFSGLLICPVCGNRLTGHTVHKDNGWQRSYYNCPRNEVKSYCTCKKWYREDMIESYLLSHIDSKVETITASPKTTAKSYKPQRDAIQKKINKLQDLYINDLIEISEYKKRYTELSDELAAIPPDEPSVDTASLKKTFTADWKDLYNDLPKEGQQMFWRETIENITLSDDGVADFSLRKNTT